MSYPARREPFPDWPDGEPALLTWDDLDVVLAALAELAPGWSAALNQASPDESTIVVMPEGMNDLIGPAFILHKDGGRVRLDQFRWDEYRKLGAYACLDDALAAMRARLVPLVVGRALDRNSGE